MASDGKPPALPETDDPYELLGVARDADAATVKKAYARLVRLYRPDRSPREFQKVHAAFEIARSAGDARVVLPPPIRTPPTPPPDEATPTRLAQRVAGAGESFAERCALIDALLAEQTPLDLIFTHETLRDTAVRHRTLTWSQLAAASTDIGAVQAVWEAIWRYAFDHDRDRAASLLDDDRLRRDAGEHPAIAAACIDRIAALNWLHSFDERRLLRQLREACPSPAAWLGHELDAIELELEGASAIRQRDWPEPLHVFVKLVIARRIDGRERCAELARALVASLTADLAATWSTFDQLVREISLQPFYEIMYEALPRHYTRLDALAEDQLARLSGALGEAGTSPLTWKIRGGVMAGAAVLGAISWIPGAVLLGGAVTYGLATEALRYRTQIRPRLAKVILDVPVTSEVVLRWVSLNRKLAGRLPRFTPGIDSDLALFTFSLLVCYADVVM